VSNDPLLSAATTLGTEHGDSFATRMYAKHIGVALAPDIIEGYEIGDEDIMSLCPEPLSGEYAGEPGPMFVLGEIANLAEGVTIIKYDDHDDILEAYEKAYRETFWSSLIGKLKDLVDGQTN
jgi:hypothetical protein